MSLLSNGFKMGKRAGGGGDFGLASREFDGVNDFVDVGVNLPNVTTTFTIACWFKADVFSGYKYLVGVQNSGSDGGRILRLNGASLEWQLLGSAIRSVTSGALTAGQWYHASGIFDKSGGDEAELFLDGASQGTVSLIGVTFSAVLTNLKFGIRPDSASLYLDGKMADIRIYDRVLTAPEIANLASGVDVSSGLHGWYLRNTDDVLDYGSGGNNGTNSGTLYSTDGPLD